MPNTPQYGRGQVIEIINSVLNKVDHNNQGISRDVFLHLAELAQTIDNLKKDISSVQPGHVRNSHIPDATDELDEVVRATADATNKIMDLCEEIGTISGNMEGPQAEEISGKVAQIFEACSFQDITGQRIRNVVSTFKVIDDKVDKIMRMLGDTMGLKISTETFEKEVSVDDEKSLLNGPQMADKAISQEDIDKLLADFDNQ